MRFVSSFRSGPAFRWSGSCNYQPVRVVSMTSSQRAVQESRKGRRVVGPALRSTPCRASASGHSRATARRCRAAVASSRLAILSLEDLHHDGSRAKGQLLHFAAAMLRARSPRSLESGRRGGLNRRVRQTGLERWPPRGWPPATWRRCSRCGCRRCWPPSQAGQRWRRYSARSR